MIIATLSNAFATEHDLVADAGVLPRSGIEDGANVVQVARPAPGQRRRSTQHGRSRPRAAAGVASGFSTALRRLGNGPLEVRMARHGLQEQTDQEQRGVFAHAGRGRWWCGGHAANNRTATARAQPARESARFDSWLRRRVRWCWTAAASTTRRKQPAETKAALAGLSSVGAGARAGPPRT